MSTLAAYAALFLAVIAFAVLAYWFGKSRGRIQAERDALENETDLRNKARDSRQRLDPDERQRLRKRFGKRRDV